MIFLPLILFAFVGVLARYESNSKNNIAIYWGQNSKGDQGGGLDAQKPLLAYCENSEVDVDIDPSIRDRPDHSLAGSVTYSDARSPANRSQNFASQGIKPESEYCGIKDGVQDCSKLGEDIKRCQKEHQKTILLSVGGSRGGFSFPDQKAAHASAQLLWNAFGSSNSSSTVPRPFDDAAVDGFDIDIENTGNFLLDWARKLRELTEGKALLTGAPMCRGPEAGKQPMDLILADDLLDIAFVQFYNDDRCEPLTPTFNFRVWDTWAKGKTKKKTKIFMGLAAGPSAVTGYVSPEQLGVIDVTKASASFGGIMLWDASQAWANNNYHKKMREHLV